MKKSCIYAIVLVALAAMVAVLVISNGTKKEKVKYYQAYREIDAESLGTLENGWVAQEIELNSDGSVKWYYGGSNSGGAEYKGTYVENDKSVIMTLELITEDGKCDDSQSLNACNLTLTLSKVDDTLEEEGRSCVQTPCTYTKVDKSSLKLLK